MHMTFEELGQCQITFGQAKLGQTFQEVVEQDRRYTAWFVSKYATSEKICHRKFIRYVELFVEKAEVQKKTPQSKKMAKAKSAPHANMAETEPVPSSSEEEPVQDGETWDVIEHRALQDQRLESLEGAMGQIINQLQILTQNVSPENL